MVSRGEMVMAQLLSTEWKGIFDRTTALAKGQRLRLSSAYPFYR